MRHMSGSGGWAIGEREAYSEDQDGLHASAIYYLLENEIVPMFYERREQTPREWMRRVKQSLTVHHAELRLPPHGPRIYDASLYEPAHTQHMRMLRGDYSLLREKAHWNSKIREVWDRVRFVDRGRPAASVVSGKPLPVRAAIELAGLDTGRRAGGNGAGTHRQQRPPGRDRSDGPARCRQQGSVAIFGKEIVPERTGRLGYALRVSPNHFDDPLTRPCTSS